MRHGVFLWIIGLSLSACIDHQAARLPDAWGAQKASKADNICPDITGTYLNRGEDAPDNKLAAYHREHPQYLSRFFTYGTLVNHRKHRWLDRIHINGVSKQHINIDMYKQNQRIQRITLHQDKDFACTEQGIVISSSYSPTSPVAIYKRNTHLLLRKGSKGALVVSEKKSEAGVVLPLIPFSGSDTQHYRFPAVEDTP